LSHFSTRAVLAPPFQRIKIVFGRGSASDPAGGRSPDPIVGWEGDTNIIAQMLSIGGEGVTQSKKTAGEKCFE